MTTRIVAGRAGVVREVRAAAPLMTTLRAPIPARGPWLTTVLHAGTPGIPPFRARPLAVVVERDPLDPPAAVGLLSITRRGPLAVVTMLGQTGVPVPGGRPAARLLAADDDAAAQLAAGIVDLLGSLRAAWVLRLTGLPLGDPTLRALAAAVPGSVLANERSEVLLDRLDSVVPSGLVRLREPGELERRLPAVLAREPDRHARGFLRSAARLLGVLGQLELAVAADRDGVEAALVTLIDGDARWPWWGSSDVGGLDREMGAPLVGFTARGGRRAPQLPWIPGLAGGGRWRTSRPGVDV